MARPLRFSCYALVALVGVFVVLGLGERAVWHDHVLPGVRLVSVGVGGAGLGDARRVIAQRAADLEREPLVVLAGDRQFTVTAGEVGLDLDEGAAYRRVRRAGRAGNPLAQAAGVVLRRLRPDEVRWHAALDRSKVTRQVDQWAAVVDAPARDGGLTIDGDTVTPVLPAPGVTLRRGEAVDLVGRALLGDGPRTLRLPVEYKEPIVVGAEVERALAKVRPVLAAPSTILVDGHPISLSASQVGRTLRVGPEGSHLRVDLPADGLRRALGAQLSALETPYRNARFVVEGEPPVVRIEESATGRGLDLAPVAEALLGGAHRVDAHLQDVPPAIDTNRAYALRIVEPVSTFTTNHPVGQPRVQNIHRIADLLQDRLIQPGERLSLNQAAGPRTRQRGFVKAPVIYEGEFTEDVGGGVSQFATTLFNAAFFGGYKIVSHHPHSVYISRYPMGREATVSFPAPDLVIENDSQTGFLVRTSYTDSSITVTLFGDREGRSVRAEGPNVGRRTKAGYNVEVFRVIDRPAQPPVRERFVTHYRLHAARTPKPPRPPTSAPPPADVPPPTSAPPPADVPAPAEAR